MNDEANELDEEIRKAGRNKIEKKKLNSIINKIEKENSKFLKKNKQVLQGLVPTQKNRVEVDKTIETDEEENEKNKEEDKEIEIDIEDFSVIKKTKNCCIKFFYCLLPYKSHLKIIKDNYNTTVLLLFKIYRFLVLMSFFALLIFIFECIYHFVKIKDNLKEICKYGIPCLFHYSSFIPSEASVYSITYGVWLIFFSICSIAYYFVLSSEQEEQEIYFQNNKNIIASAYLVTSWNFNYKKESISTQSKQAIHNELKLYAKNFVDKLEESEIELYSPLAVAISHICFVIFILVYFWIFFLVFYIRDLIRNKAENLAKIGIKDIIADFVSFIIIAIFIHLFQKLTGIFANYEGWRYERHKNISDLVKKMVTFFVGFFTLLHIYTYFTLYTNNLKKNIPFFGVSNNTFFGCPGTYYDGRRNITIFTADVMEENFDSSKTTSYARCREEETGIDFLFIFLFYFLFTFIFELCESCCNFCFGDDNENPSFEPTKSMVQVFNTIILYSIAMFYIPYLSLFFPLITIALYKYQFSKLKSKGSYSFKETGITKRNNTKILLIIYFIFTVELIAFQGYFYFLPFPHFYKASCYAPKEGSEFKSSVLIYNFDRIRCGPINSNVRLSSIFTELMEDAPIFGWIVGIIEEMPFLIVVIALVFIVILYRKYNPDSRYYEYLLKRQKGLDNNFQMFYEQISKRDVLTSMLLKVTKQEE